MMQRAAHELRPLTAGDRDTVIRLLAEGFPKDGEDFWRRSLHRQASLQGEGHGFLLDVGGRPVGVMLTLRSRRLVPEGGTRELVNLSSWYIEPSHRWRAASMLRSAMADDNAIYTDLTAVPNIYRLNEKVGLSTWNTGMILASAAPFAAMPSRRGARMIAPDEAGDLLHPLDAEMLDWHQRDGLVAAVLIDEAAHPLLFRIIRRKGLRFGQLIHAPSRKAVIRNLPTIMRFLARSGIVFITIDADREICPAAAFFRPGRQRFRRGPIGHDRLDYAYSELVLFGVS